MSGVLVPILSKTVYDYNFLPNSTSRSVVLARAIDVTPFKSTRMIVRVHDASLATGATITVAAYGSFPSEEDSQEFLTTSAEMSAQLTSGMSVPSLLIDSEADSYPFWKIILTASRSVTAGNIYGVISVSLLVREH
jgi:hypothetical protein